LLGGPSGRPGRIRAMRVSDFARSLVTAGFSWFLHRVRLPGADPSSFTGCRDRMTNRGATRSESWAVLVGVEKYEKAQPRSGTRSTTSTHTGRDAPLSRQLSARPTCLEMTDAHPERSRRPLKASIQSALPRFLARVRAARSAARLLHRSRLPGRRGTALPSLRSISIPDDPRCLWHPGRVAPRAARNLPRRVQAADPRTPATPARRKGDVPGFGCRLQGIWGEPFPRPWRGSSPWPARPPRRRGQIWEDKQQSLFQLLARGRVSRATPMADGDGAVGLSTS